MTSPEETFEGRRTSRDLLVAEWRYEGAWLPDGVVEEIDIELLDPGDTGSAGWVDVYAEELDRFPALAYALAAENPVAEIARRAKIPANELTAFRMWASEASVRDIGRALGKGPSTVHALVVRARFRVLEWLVRGVPNTDAPITYIEGSRNPARAERSQHATHQAFGRARAESAVHRS